jgi:hypothetical protein
MLLWVDLICGNRDYFILDILRLLIHHPLTILILMYLYSILNYFQPCQSPFVVPRISNGNKSVILDVVKRPD